jgi:hypothetical protein
MAFTTFLGKTITMSYDPFKAVSPPVARSRSVLWTSGRGVSSMRPVDDERWEAVYLADGHLYKTQVFASRVLAERDLMRTKDALEATGWRLSEAR